MSAVWTVNETFDPGDVTARSGSHIVTSSFVRRLQCILLSVIYSLGAATQGINVVNHCSKVSDTPRIMTHACGKLFTTSMSND